MDGQRPYFDEYIGRSVRNTEFFEDSFWANPYRPNEFECIDDCLCEYEHYIRNKLKYCPEKILELEGKILGCWCKPSKCHGDILIKLLYEYKRNLFL